MKKTIHVEIDSKEAADCLIERTRNFAGNGAGSAHIEIRANNDGQIDKCVVTFQTTDPRKL